MHFRYIIAFPVRGQGPSTAPEQSEGPSLPQYGFFFRIAPDIPLPVR